MVKADTSRAEAPADLVELGRIASAYGVRGWVKIQPHSSHAQVLLEAKIWWLKSPAPVEGAGVSSSVFAVDIEACRPQGSALVAQFTGISDRDHAESLKGHTVWVSRDSFPSADDDEYYWVDLIGCLLYGDQDGQSVLIGKVAEVSDNGAHALLRVVRATTGADGELATMHDNRGRAIEVLVPFVSAHVHTVDLANKRLESNWPVQF